MTEAAAARTGAGEDVRAVADTFVDLVRTFHRARVQMLAAAAHDVEWSGHLVLKVVANAGPMRSTDVAECLHSDPSTISRQVAGLVKEGLLERRADPEDGRASLLVTTERAREILVDHDESRVQHFARMLHSWDDGDVHTFAALLRRFTDDFQRSTQAAPPLGGKNTSRTDPRSGGSN